MKQEYITIISKRIKKEDTNSGYSLYYKIRIPQPDPSVRWRGSTDHNACL